MKAADHLSNRLMVVMASRCWTAKVSEEDAGAEGVPYCFFDATLDSFGLRVDLAQRLVLIPSEQAADAATLEHIILDVLLPALLSYDGHLVLHAALVSNKTFAFGVFAPSGRGKSTLTASLHAAGFDLLGDDGLIVRQTPLGCVAERIYPSLRLFPDSIKRLFPDVATTEPVATYTSKRRLNVDETVNNAPLRALFRLTEPSDSINVTRLPPAAACMAIIENAFAFDPEDRNEARRRFEQAATLARTIPIFDLHYPRDYDALPKVHAAILDALERSKLSYSPEIGH